MQKLNEKKILGTVPKKLQLVETFWDCPEFSKNKQNQKGITLIALIITIIVMLILVGVTINVALNRGLFTKAEEATTKTKIAQIQEALTIKKAEVLADYNGKTPTDYGITISNLDIPGELKTEYGSKLKISTDGKLYYDASVVTNATEQNEFKELGIGEYVETNKGDSYTFTIGELANKGILSPEEASNTVLCAEEEFWPQDVSDELKSSVITKQDGIKTYNIICFNSEYINMFDTGEMHQRPNAFAIYLYDGMILLGVFNEKGEPINMRNYTNYADLTFTITMAE